MSPIKRRTRVNVIVLFPLQLIYAASIMSLNSRMMSLINDIVLRDVHFQSIRPAPSFCHEIDRHAKDRRCHWFQVLAQNFRYEKRCALKRRHYQPETRLEFRLLKALQQKEWIRQLLKNNFCCPCVPPPTIYAKAGPTCF